MKILIVENGKAPYPAEIRHDIHAMQSVVGGCIEPMHFEPKQDAIVWCNNEFLLNNSTPIDWWETALVSGIAKDGGIDHMWFYMGQFDSKDAVLDYLVKLGYDINSASPYVGSGNGDGGRSWRIECNGSQGCVINNNTDGKARFKSFVAYKITSYDVTFRIKKCLDGTSQIIGKSPVDGSTAKYGVYSNKA